VKEVRMEQRTVTLEKLTSEQGRLTAEMRADINGLKERIMDIKEMLQNLKKGDKLSDGGESSVNGEERREDRSRYENKSDVDEEGELKPWSRRVELPIFEGVDLMGWLARAEIFFEVQNVSTREGCSWLSSAWKAKAVLGSLFGERIPRTIFWRSFPWH